jgi:hypothetical protein
MPRRISWFSCGAASAVATKLSAPDEIVYCNTGSEDADNHRFMAECEAKWFSCSITAIQSEKHGSTWDVWNHRKYISGIAGAPCTYELKVKPRLMFERPDDIHIFGYTCDANDIRRAESLREFYPDLKIETPLIDNGLSKAACLAMIERAGIAPPRVYAMGFKNANCIPCCKATSPSYWALVRQEFPEQFDRMAVLSRKLGARLSRIDNERIFIDEIPEDHPTTEPLSPECDFLCSIAEAQYA